MSVDLAALATIPYLDIKNLPGRFVSTLMFYDAGTWRMWVPAGDKLLEIKAWPVESFYFAAEPESPHDLYFHFLDFIAQRAGFPTVQKPTLGLHDDVFNLCASLAKIVHLHKIRDGIGDGVSRMIVTEIEYLFSVCRSIFDLLQEIIVALWDSIHLHDTSVVKKPLKETFAKMVLFDGRPATSQELVERFGLPSPLADYYVRNTEFFLSLREFRDNVVHRGSRVQTIFASDAGFLIQHELRPFSAMRIWIDDEKSSTGLVPLSPAIATLIYRTLAACEDFSSTISGIVEFPPPIVPGMSLFMRGYFNETASAALRDARERIEKGLDTSRETSTVA